MKSSTMEDLILRRKTLWHEVYCSQKKNLGNWFNTVTLCMIMGYRGNLVESPGSTTLSLDRYIVEHEALRSRSVKLLYLCDTKGE
jgi:hypothetical protein